MAHAELCGLHITHYPLLPPQVIAEIQGELVGGRFIRDFSTKNLGVPNILHWPAGTEYPEQYTVGMNRNVYNTVVCIHMSSMSLVDIHEVMSCVQYGVFLWYMCVYLCVSLHACVCASIRHNSLYTVPPQPL